MLIEVIKSFHKRIQLKSKVEVNSCSFDSKIFSLPLEQTFNELEDPWDQALLVSIIQSILRCSTFST
jgi:hypothetical protein